MSVGQYRLFRLSLTSYGYYKDFLFLLDEEFVIAFCSKCDSHLIVDKLTGLNTVVMSENITTILNDIYFYILFGVWFWSNGSFVNMNRSLGLNFVRE